MRIMGVVVFSMLFLMAACRHEASGAKSLDALLSSLPSDAENVSTNQLKLWGRDFVNVSYGMTSQIKSPGIGVGGGVISLGREFNELYLWDGQWRKVLNSYDWAQSHFGDIAIGPVTDGNPRPETAIVSAKFYPVRLEEKKQDFIVLEISFALGPSGRQQPSPTVAVLRWNGSKLDPIWSKDLGVRGGIVYVDPTDFGFEVVADAYLANDPLCCPNGWEHLTFNVSADGSLFSEQCLTKRNSACPASNKP